jgi:hypothetical protein
MRPKHGLSGRGVSKRVRSLSSARVVTAPVHCPPPKGLEGGADGLQPPGCDLRVECLLQTLEACGGFVDGSDVCLKDALLSRGGRDHLAEPSEGGRAPGGPAWVPDGMPEHEGLQPNLGRFASTDGGFTRAGEVADRVSFPLGHIDGGQITRAHQPRQVHGVAAVGFHPVARLVRNYGGGDDPAEVACLGQITIEPLPPRARFIAKDEGCGLGVLCADEVIAVDVSCADGAEGDHGRVMILRDVRHSDSRLMDIPPDVKRARRVHG